MPFLDRSSYRGKRCRNRGYLNVCLRKGASEISQCQCQGVCYGLWWRFWWLFFVLFKLVFLFRLGKRNVQMYCSPHRWVFVPTIPQIPSLWKRASYASALQNYGTKEAGLEQEVWSFKECRAFGLKENKLLCKSGHSNRRGSVSSHQNWSISFPRSKDVV